MANVKFDLRVEFADSAIELWRTMTDWRDHARWIPATKVWITKPGIGVGVEFVARSGFWPLIIDDRMRVTISDPHTMHAEVEKFGKALKGTAGFRINSSVAGSELIWFENIYIPHVPNVFNRVLTFATKIMFQLAMRNLKRKGLKPKRMNDLPPSQFATDLVENPKYYGLNFEIKTAQELTHPTLLKFTDDLLQCAAKFPITAVVIDFTQTTNNVKLNLRIKTADRQTAHDLIADFSPIEHKHRLQDVGSDLESVHNRFGTLDFVAIAPQLG